MSRCCPAKGLPGGALVTVNRKVVIGILQSLQQFIQYIAGWMEHRPDYSTMCANITELAFICHVWTWPWLKLVILYSALIP